MASVTVARTRLYSGVRQYPIQNLYSKTRTCAHAMMGQHEGHGEEVSTLRYPLPTHLQ